MEQQFNILGTFPSLNDYIGAERRHRMIAAKIKKNCTEAVALSARAAKLQPFAKPVTLTIEWREANAKRDPDNIIFAKKFILDGLVAAGVLPNDTQRWIKGLSETWLVDKENVGITVTIKEV